MQCLNPLIRDGVPVLLRAQVMALPLAPSSDCTTPRPF